MYFDRLRHANTTRQAEWPGGEHVDLDFRGIELAGEAGELINLIKKKVRIDNGISGTTESKKELAAMIQDEIGDVVICLDLVGMEMGFDLYLPDPEVAPPTYSSLSKLGNALNGRIGFANELIANYNSGSVKNSAIESHLASTCGLALVHLTRLCDMLQTDVWVAVGRKFDKTSEKHGLETRF